MWSAAALAALMLTSCLGDSNNEGSLSHMPGVTRLTTTGVVVDTPAGTVYTPDFLTMGYYGEGDCMFVSFSYDLGTPENANSATQGYTYINLTEKPTPVNRFYTDMSATDTTTLLPNEMALEYAIGSYDATYFAANLNGYMFLTSTFTGLTNQKNRWHLFFDYSQEPVVNDSKNMYTLFLRATITDEGTTPSGTAHESNAYDVSAAISSMQQRERTLGNKTFLINVRYLKKIDKDDPTKLEWSDSTYPIEYYSTTEEDK